MENKLVINNRDELVVLDLDRIAFICAEGNYSRIVTIKKREMTMTLGISKLEDTIRQNALKPVNYVRLSRSLIVNHRFLSKIDLVKQVITLSDGDNVINIKASKQNLKKYKTATVQAIQIKQNKEK